MAASTFELGIEKTSTRVLSGTIYTVVYLP